MNILICNLTPRPSAVIASTLRTRATARTLVSIGQTPRNSGIRSPTHIRALATHMYPTAYTNGVQLTTKEQLYRDIRTAANCGDTYPECAADSDCGNNRLACYASKCVPNITHCVHKGCSTEYEQCDTTSGECLSTRKTCAADNDCAQGNVCQDGKCYKEASYCRSDLDCIGSKTDTGAPANKCDREQSLCVPCNFGEPSLCATQNPARPSCDPNSHQCFPTCSPVTPTTDSECCSSWRIHDTRLPLQKDRCCANDWNKTWTNPLWHLGTERCQLPNEGQAGWNSRRCDVAFGGNLKGNIQCYAGSCNIDGICR